MITGIAGRAGLEDNVTAHVLRHAFATTLVRRGTDLIIAAELLGHARLETTRAYTRPPPSSAAKRSIFSPWTSNGKHSLSPVTSAIIDVLNCAWWTRVWPQEAYRAGATVTAAGATASRVRASGADCLTP